MSAASSASSGRPAGTTATNGQSSAEEAGRSERSSTGRGEGEKNSAAARRWGKKQRRLHERLNAFREERREGRPPRRPEVAVPSFFTLLNLFCGFLALTQVFESEFAYACWLIVLAGFFDALDGLTARLADAQSPFGVELDSLSDVVSFGIAPAFLVWAYGLNAFGPLGLLVAALPALCGAVRLARYNVGFEGTKEDFFEGLPIPAQAVTIIALILTLEEAEWFSRTSEGNLSILIPAVLVLAGLMVSNVRFGAFPKPTPSYAKAHPYKIGAYLLGVFLLPFLQEVALLFFLVGYIASGVLHSTYRVVHAIMEAPLDGDGAPPDSPS